MTMIMMIYGDADDVHVDVLMHVSNDHDYDGNDINVNDNDSCDSTQDLDLSQWHLNDRNHGTFRS